MRLLTAMSATMATTANRAGDRRPDIPAIHHSLQTTTGEQGLESQW